MASTSDKPRVPRQSYFVRNPSPAAFRITNRDGDILAALARFRFLYTDQIVRLVGGSEQQINRRLRGLFDHGFTTHPERQKLQLAGVHEDGNPPGIHGLATAGARVLAARGFPGIDGIDWTTKSERASAEHLLHTVETAETIIAFQQACRAGGGASKLVDHQALLPYFPEATRSDDDPLMLEAHVRMPSTPEPLRIAVVPDRVFSLHLDVDARVNFALEHDRGTMDVNAKKLIGKSSFRRKIVGYWAAWRAGMHTERWGFKSFRVLTVTTSEARIDTMLKVQRQVVGEHGSNVFAFTTFELLKTVGPLEAIWVTGKGDVVRLLEPVTS